MCRIGGRLRGGHASDRGADLEIPPFNYLKPNPRDAGTMFGG